MKNKIIAIGIITLFFITILTPLSIAESNTDDSDEFVTVWGYVFDAKTRFIRVKDPVNGVQVKAKKIIGKEYDLDITGADGIWEVSNIPVKKWVGIRFTHNQYRCRGDMFFNLKFRRPGTYGPFPVFMTKKFGIFSLENQIASLQNSLLFTRLLSL
jgi:hypothetical protein